MKVIHHKMDLFDAPKGSVLVHAVNCQGVWGSGIAAEFHRRFPKSFASYERQCSNGDVLGKALCTAEGDYWIGSLFTSYDYGKRVDPPESILANTKLAVEYLFKVVPKNFVIYSNQFNSGLFNVPWAQTEGILLNHPLDRIWNVCAP